MNGLVIGRSVVEWMCAHYNHVHSYGADTAIGWQKDGELVAGVAYANWNGVNIEAHIVSDKSRRWLTREYLWTICDYPFNQVGAKRVTIVVAEGNQASRAFVEHLGFKIEARLADADPTGALLIYRLLKDECRWIKQQPKRLAMAA